MTDRVPASWDEALEALVRGESGPVILGPVVSPDGDGPHGALAKNGNQPHPRTLAGHPLGRVRGVLAEDVVVSTELDPLMSLKALARYSDCSVRWLRDRLTDPHHPLPCYRVPGGKILVRKFEFDAWMARYRQVGHADVDRVVSEVLRDYR